MPTARSPRAAASALLEAEGVPFRGARVDMRVARLPPGFELGRPDAAASPAEI